MELNDNEFHFMGVEHFLQTHDFLITLVRNGVETTYKADVMTLPAEIPSLLDVMSVEKVTPVDDSYPIIQFASDFDRSFESQMAAIRLWVRFLNRLRNISIVGRVEITDFLVEETQ
jgi:hypothetical protein